MSIEEELAPEPGGRPAIQGTGVAEVLAGLRARPRRIPPKYFYDERGSALFEQICGLPEYYLTRTETAILERHAGEMAARIGAEALVVEYGSGTSSKTRLLLERLERPVAYVPVDISSEPLLAAARRLAMAYPALEVLPLCADFTQPFTLPPTLRAPRRRLAFFPGSTLGNFDRGPATALLRGMRNLAGHDGALLIGIDLVKAPAVLVRAYDDAAGVTAAFNLNLLTHLNRALGTDFDVRAFRHEACWVPAHERIEMHLVSLRRQAVRLGRESIALGEGERIVTEHCHKYTRASFAALAGAAGWRVEHAWQDEAGQFSVQLLR
jgi:L-histidine Nalpha-methyltransferase